MTIKNRLSLYFTAFAAVFVLAISAVVYIFSRDYTIKEFNDRLLQRVEITAMAKLEADELNAKIYADLQRRHFQKLLGEKEYFIEVDLQSQTLLEPVPLINFPKDFFSDIFETSPLFFQSGNVSFCAIVYPDNEGDFIIISSAVDQYGQNKLQNLVKILSVCLAVSTVLIFLTGRFYAKKALSPLDQFILEMAQVQASNLNNRLPETQMENEVALLTRTFNQLLNRLETSFEIQNNFIGNASHELKNPLAAILGTIEIALNKNRTADAYRLALEDVQLEALRLEEITLQLLQLARTSFNKTQLPLAPFNFMALLDTIVANLNKTKPNSTLQLLANKPAILITGTESLLYVAFYNFIDNACKFANGKPVTISITEKDNTVVFVVKDQGIGIPEQDLLHIFEPFYRSSNTRNFKGFGIGLPLAKKIIEMHKGTIDVQSQELKGTTIVVVLPLH